ncbi:hypothetical protein [Streptomyces sp. NPDC094466]|uniref:hypothetical protein n=1 Tax=Streptomyces sp. NPDC094466 TaxID=3366065 RepID=UPI00380F6E85
MVAPSCTAVYEATWQATARQPRALVVMVGRVEFGAAGELSAWIRSSPYSRFREAVFDPAPHP